MTANCRACGAEVFADAAFCHHCGQPLQAPVPPAASDTAEQHSAASSPTSAAPMSVQAVRFEENDVASPADESADEPAEQTLWEGSYSPKAMLGGWILAALVTLVVAAIGSRADVGQGLFLGLLTAALCFGGTGLYVMYLKLSAHYQLTSQRFVHQTGLVRRTTDRVEVIDVDDVAFSQGLFQRLVGVGTIKIMSSDCSHPELYLEGIDDVARVASLIDEACRAERRRRGLYIETV
jgi:hypothetical protein